MGLAENYSKDIQQGSETEYRKQTNDHKNGTKKIQLPEHSLK